ncbi:MAG: 50S ribosomal protein L13 [Methanobacteriota archaeon]
MIVDAQDLVLGRMASFVAKTALKGENIVVVNAEKALVSGKRDDIIRRNMAKLDIKNKGNFTKGPYHQRRPDKYVRSAIKGMLPHQKPRGIEAFNNIMVYIGFPKEVIEKDLKIQVSKEEVVKPPHLSKNLDKYITVGELCTSIGGRY